MKLKPSFSNRYFKFVFFLFSNFFFFFLYNFQPIIIIKIAQLYNAKEYKKKKLNMGWGEEEFFVTQVIPGTV